MEEIWKDIEGYEGMYQVSNTGKVRACARTTTVCRINRRGHIHDEEWSRHERILVPIDCGAAMYVRLYKEIDGKKTRMSVTIKELVYNTFNGTKFHTRYIKYRDNNRFNTSLDNLYHVAKGSQI